MITKNRKTKTSSAGAIYKPLGLSITQFFKFSHSCMEAKCSEMQSSILKLCLLDKLLEIFLTSAGNNVIQNSFVAIVKLVINLKAGPLFEYVDSDDADFPVRVFKKTATGLQ